MDKETITLTDGTELIPLEEKEKEALEAELKVVLEKYNAIYLPTIRKEDTLSRISQTAVLFLLKRKPKEEGVKSPYKENGDDTTKETPATN